MSKLFEKSPVRSFNSEQFHRFVQPTDKNYAVAALFTTTHPDHVCPSCRKAAESLRKVAKSYKPNDEPRIFFVIIDFKGTPDVFRELEITSAPVLYFFNARSPARDARKLFFEGDSPSIDSIIKVVFQETNQRIRVVDADHFMFLLGMCILALVGVFLLCFAAEKYKVFGSTLIWSTVCLIHVTFFISGFMWNQIRGARFSRPHEEKWIDRMVSTTQSYQYGAESIFVGAIYLTVAVSLLLLDKAGKFKKGPSLWIQKVLKICGIVLFVVGLNSMMYLFVRKSPYYPYTLFR